MLVKILITLFITLPPALGIAAQSEQKMTLNIVRYHLVSEQNDAKALFNYALIEQKNGTPAMALALSERSRFLNPVNFDAVKLTSLSYDQLSDQHNERPLAIPLTFKVLDFLPYFVVILLSICSILIFMWNLGQTIQQEAVKFRSQPKLRLKTTILGAFVGLMLCLTWVKSQSLQQTWACIVSNEAGLFTGPSSTQFTKVGSLNSGSCSRVVQTKDFWLSLSPSNRTPGWVKKSEVLVVRANKFDPLFK